MESPFTERSSAEIASHTRDQVQQDAAVRGELERVLTSPALRDSDGLKRFLRYIVEHTLAGEGDRLKEYRLGLEVFDRDPSFDPKIDPVVRMAARRLRAKLQEFYENGGRGSRVRIEVPKGGYAVVFITTEQNEGQPALEMTAETSGMVSAVPGTGWKRRPFSGKTYWIVVSVLFGAIASYLLYQRHARSLHVNAEMPSLAVLPFLNLTGNPDNDFISDGITEEITATMAQAAGLRVVARTSAFQFKGKAENIRDIGRRLNASSVLEGSIQAQKDQLRITTQLIRTSDGYHLWAETYDLPSKDRFAVEDEITRNLFRALNARLSAQAEVRGKKHEVDPAAHELYLRGVYLRQHASPADVEKAINYFNQALDRDPLYAEAYAGLSASYAIKSINAWTPASEVYPKARAAALRAIELDPDLPEAHVTLATLNFFYERNLAAAEQEFRRGIELNPNSDRAHLLYGILLLCSRRFDEARVQYNLAKQVNPLAVQIDLNLVMLAQAERKYDDAIVMVRKVLEENDNALGHMLLGLLYADKKQYEESIAEGEKGAALAPNDGDTNFGLAILYAQAGQRDKAQTLLQKTLGSGVFVPPFTVAGVYAALGEREQMYAWLDKAVEQQSPAVLRLNIAEPFDPYRPEARFEQIVAKVGLQSFQVGDHKS
jgi:TolB-like protein/Flp pilus assembly protein TadD